jgi:hypothetical protein
VAGYVQGHRQSGARFDDATFPTDSEIWLAALRCARKFPDIYPTLKGVALESEELADDDRVRAEVLRQMIEGARHVS